MVHEIIIQRSACHVKFAWHTTLTGWATESVVCSEQAPCARTVWSYAWMIACTVLIICPSNSSKVMFHWTSHTVCHMIPIVFSDGFLAPLKLFFVCHQLLQSAICFFTRRWSIKYYTNVSRCWNSHGIRDATCIQDSAFRYNDRVVRVHRCSLFRLSYLLTLQSRGKCLKRCLLDGHRGLLIQHRQKRAAIFRAPLTFVCG